MYERLVLVWMALAVAVWILLSRVTAPYGRYVRQGWGTPLNARMAWMVMELPSLIIPLSGLLWRRAEGVAAFFLGLWIFHYAYRSLLFPLLIRARKDVPFSVVGMALAFNLANSGFNTYSLLFVKDYASSWVSDPRFLLGVCLFLSGFVMHVVSDARLRALRSEGEGSYRIPQGWLFRWVSCPNYFGEILEWTGWALATWSLAGVSFALWTCANLVPRALSHHRWYREHFPDYPADRKALIPVIGP
ncbi:3-oxo-5-alpha-steroid 4-dehydrogenase [Spirochaeta thermophila]|uniref:3-oxo-5-alpha-steroid 4-dehydrogenase family protein n=1 Tax=Winmispira thermophila (strain ATCC 49972 / DSM 6192 / RI 19.B1) TaxID=665571 RepID=E0RNK1_WINT6|nr:3-oxo-5-alpha-steroid 4-dehydrogenase [Spirochaeta thermophila]ADN02592.1 3-oxo-5-alpha-steroid 4-dehydrogenase family protein [Spirochaeta thermophila DSM 6192]